MTARRTWAAIVFPALLAGCNLHQWRPGSVDAYRPVFEQAARGDVAAVAAALDREPRLIRAREEDRLTLLLDAAGEGQRAMASFLLSRGADPNARTGGGLTPLHLAAQNGDVEMIGVLLSHGARVNATDRRGMTPLDQAVSHEHADAAASLRSHGGKARRHRPPADASDPA